MQTLSGDLHACVLDLLDFDRGSVVESVGMLARVTVDALLALALVGRARAADAQARLRPTLMIGDLAGMASIGVVGLRSLETLVTARWDWSASLATHLDAFVKARLTTRKYIGIWPVSEHWDETGEALASARCRRQVLRGRR